MAVSLLTPGVLRRTLLRTLLFQASWNFERLQSLGALYALAPGLRRIYRGERLREAFERYSSYFNTHPFLASPVVGMILALEEERNEKGSNDVPGEDLRKMVMAPYAAMGDALFWGGVRPLAAGAALLVATKGSYWAPLVLLTVFNLPHIWFRWYGLLLGYRLGIEMLPCLQRWKLPDLAIRVKETTVVLLGGVCAFLAAMTVGEAELSTGWGFVLLPAIALLSYLVRKGVSVLALVWALAGGWLLVGYFLT